MKNKKTNQNKPQPKPDKKKKSGSPILKHIPKKLFPGSG